MGVFLIFKGILLRLEEWLRVVIDMYEPYISLIKSVFSNAVIIFDRFHIV